MNKKLILAALFFAAPSIVFADVAVSTISCSQLRLMELNKTQGLTLLDVRLPPDFAKGHIQGARNIPEAAILSAGLSKSGTLVVYCGEASCPLSHLAAEALIAKGYQNVSVLDGGIAAWIQKGYPIKISRKPRIRVKHISARAERDKILAKKIFVIDLRPASGYQAGHIPGAVNIPLESLAQNISEIPRNGEVLVYDLIQSRMRRGVKELKNSGIKARELSGGFSAWVKEKNPVEVKE
jgi:rhodanese-related sulfurtransferase